MDHAYTYEDALKASQKINWCIEDVIGGERRLDFDKPFLPESLARVQRLTFLDTDDRLALNQIRGHAYLYLFGLVEEFIVPFVLEHVRPRLQNDEAAARAMLQFASEEIKHIRLFKRFRREFEDGFGSACDVIGPPEVVSEYVLSHHPLSIALATLHVEWMTQRHYLGSVKDDWWLDPQFKSLLRHHWMEEAQHAKLDTLIVEALAATCSKDEITQAVDGYVQICNLLDTGLKQQVALDIESLRRVTGRVLSEIEHDEFSAVQLQANRWTYLGTGMTHLGFQRTLGKISPAGLQTVQQIALVLT